MQSCNSASVIGLNDNGGKAAADRQPAIPAFTDAQRRLMVSKVCTAYSITLSSSQNDEEVKLKAKAETATTLVFKVDQLETALTMAKSKIDELAKARLTIPEELGASYPAEPRQIRPTR